MIENKLHPIKHIHPITIREFHLDYFGHVSHTIYPVLLEEARWEMITSRGFGLERVQGLGFGPIVLEMNMKFRRELKLRQNVSIETEVISYAKKIAILKQEVRDGEGRIYCSAEIKNGLFDLEKRKLIPATPEWLKALGLEAQPLS